MDDKTFDLNDMDNADTSEMVVLNNDIPTGWKWTFAGPGHPKTIAQSSRISRERLRVTARQEAARVNGKKWKPEVETEDDALKSNVTFVVERLIGWTEVNMSGQPFPFSEENARRILSDRNKPGLFLQALNFLGDDASFIKSSATT